MQKFIDKIISSQPQKIVISNPRCGNIKKITLRPVIIGTKELWQFESFTETQVFHKNVSFEKLKETLLRKAENFKQIDAFCANSEHSLKVSKKGKILSSSRNIGCKTSVPSHNREKHYILPAGTPVTPLVDLGVMTADGRIVKSKNDKFKQINRFLEIINDAIGKSGLEKISVIDFGCGKSYLTFILYYYLTSIKKIKAKIIGIDLKESVVKNCNDIAEKYGYRDLKFILSDINGYDAPFVPDMVISLHACDTATDYAIFNTVKWKARYGFFVPCCQHEINSQLDNKALSPITDYGITKERFAALLTDSIRARLLSACGYSVDMLEFIDMHHSPKNILIRAEKKKNLNKKPELLSETENYLRTLNVEQTLFTLLKNHS